MNKIINKVNDKLDQKLNPKQKQYLLLASVVIASVVMGMGFNTLFTKNTSDKGKENAIAKLVNKTKSEEKSVIVPDAKLETITEERIMDVSQDNEISTLNEEIVKLTKSINDQKALFEEKMNLQTKNFEQSMFQMKEQMNQIKNESQAPVNNVSKEEIEPEARIPAQIHKQQNPEVFNFHDTIPNGMVIKGRTVEGIQIGTSAKTAANPPQLHIKILDKGIGPGFESIDLRNCDVMATVEGKLSSERADFLVQTITCSIPEQKKYVQTKVVGHVNGPDGSRGIRGHVVFKDQKILENTAIAGIFSGFAKVVTPQASLIPFGASSTYQSTNPSDRFQMGFGQGMSSGFEKMQDVYLDYLNQLEPVIDIKPGIDVDIVFDYSAKIGSADLTQKLDKERKTQDSSLK